MKNAMAIFLIILPLMMTAQSWKSNLFSVSVFNNATMLPPSSLSATFNQPIHFGLNAAYEFGWKDAPKHKWFQNAGIGYFYHRYAYQAILLSSQAGYRFKPGKFSLEGYLQAGYMHAFYLTDRCVKQSDGTYLARQGGGKPQFIVGAGIATGYDLGRDDRIRRIFLGYYFQIQMPFVHNYVTLLPNGVLYIGFQFNLN